MGITILSFTPGTTIASASVNANYAAIVNALSGVNTNEFLFRSHDNITSPLTLRFSSQPSVDAAVLACNLPGDGGTRIDTMIDGTYGQYTGGIRSGDGTTIRAKLIGYYGGSSAKLQANGWRSEGAIWTDGFGMSANGYLIYDDPTNSWSVLDGLHSLGFRISGVHAFAATTSNSFTYGGSGQLSASGAVAPGSSYGFLTAGYAQFNVTSTYADVAEYVKTDETNRPTPGAAVCVVASDTVGPCPHRACRIAKVVSTNPSIGLAPRMRGMEHGERIPQEGHESVMPLAIGGVCPVNLVTPLSLGDRITTAGPDHPGMFDKATDDEYAVGDIITIDRDVYYAWVHY